MDADRMRQPGAMIYWVIGATHEWRCSTTHSKSPFLLFIPTANLSPTPSAHSSLSLQSLHTVSLESSTSSYIHLFFPLLAFHQQTFNNLRDEKFF